MLYNLFIFDRFGTCIFYSDWHRTKQSNSLDEEKKLLFGMLYSFKLFCEKTSPTPDAEAAGFRYFRTSSYKLHQFESGTGYRFVINSDPATQDLREELKQIYRLTVEHCLLNPLYRREQDAQLTAPTFIAAVNAYAKALPFYS